MLRAEKEKAVVEIRERFEKAQSIVVADYRGLTVNEVAKMRSEFREGGGEFKVLKNTLTRRAVEGTPFAEMAPLFEGMSGIAFGYEEPAAVAKVAVKHEKDTKKLKVKGGFFEGKALDVAGVTRLSVLPTKDEARAQLLSALIAPAQQILGVLTAPIRDLLLVLQAKSEKGGGESEAKS